MGELHVYCAGANIRDLPGKNVDSILLNVVDNFATESLAKEAERILKCASPRRIMIDNGGYPMMMAEKNGKQPTHYKTKPIKYKGKLNLTPHHVIEVIRRIQPNDFIASDFPVQKLSDALQQEAEFRRKLEFNVPWAFKCAELRQRYCPEVEMFIAIQCYNVKQLEIFLKAIDGIQLDGFSMPVRNMSLQQIALFMKRFWQLESRRVHLLGTTEFFKLALGAYMARNYFDWVSLDAKTWKDGAKFNSYVNPHDLGREEIGNDVIIDDNIQIDCNCPWCRGRTFNYIKHLPYYDKRIFLGCHNHWVIKKAARDLYQHSRSIAELESYLKQQCRKTEKISELIEALYLVEQAQK